MAPRFDLHERASGVLLHVSSLPGPYGVGDVGAAAREFASYLAGAAQRWWQMLPVGPVGYGNSPYSAHSAFAGNPLFIDLDALVDEGLLEKRAIQPPRFAPGRVDYGEAASFRSAALRAAFQAFRGSRAPAAFEQFCARESGWLEDFALYMALKRRFALRAWSSWDAPLRDREPTAIQRAREELAEELAYERFTQWLFDAQWARLRAHCAALDVALLGDLPIFVAHDSADVWANRGLFMMDAAGQPTHIAGVPPDYFSASGQRWGNPLYRWEVLREQGYAWWIARMAQMLHRFDGVRLDHFIGFVRFWQIPADEPTAMNGTWITGPGADLFNAMQAKLGTLPLVAEDLGAVTPEVTALREQFRFPGLRILQFAFGTDPQAPTFKPHNYERSTVVYTGTHDNDTTVGWFSDRGGPGTPRSAEQTEKERRACLAYLGTEAREIHLEMIRQAQRSVAELCIVPMQDWLGLGSEARMNRPGLAEGNWEWRLDARALTPALAARMAELARIYDRAPRRGAGDTP